MFCFFRFAVGWTLELKLDLSCLCAWTQVWPLLYFYILFVSFFSEIQAYVPMKNLGLLQPLMPTLGAERWHQWLWKTNFFILKMFLFYLIHFVFTFVMLFYSFCMYRVLKEHNLQLWTLDNYVLTFKNVFLIISFFFFSTHSCEKSMICKFLEVWKRWSTCLLIW